MDRILRAGLAGLCLLALAAPATAKRIAYLPVPKRIARADVVVVGEVTTIEPKTVKAPRFPGDQEKGEFRVAVVKIKEPLLGAKGLTHVKVGFIPGPGGGRPGRGAFSSTDLSKGQEALLFLHQNPEGAFYQVRNFFDLVDKKKNPNFAKDVKQARQCGKALADPMASLKSKDAGERLATAALLVLCYRTPRGGENKEEAIPAEESKLILEALAAGDWSKPPFGGALNPQQAFYLLHPQHHGFTGAKDPKGFTAAAQQWLKDNAGKYRVKRYVAAEKK